MVRKLISWSIRYLPRPFLQRMARPVLWVWSVFLKGNQVTCPVCSSSYRHFLPYGRKPARSNALCPSCLSLERHRLIWLFLKNRTDLFNKSLKFLHIAPEICFIPNFSKLEHLDYTTGDLYSPWADVKLDVHDLPFGDNTFDVLMCNHVLEHVEDDRLAMREFLRVLKPGGWAILQVPFFHPLPDKTQEDPRIKRPAERERLYGQRDHVRKYGKDYAERLREQGFQVEESSFVQDLPDEVVAKYALPVHETLFICTKPQR